ncbi:von Willebrand factor A domain-containing protein 5A-like [Dendronephthya gigantea]|uniref:von Willebrand factor A domain-containing protein 5A-like n=1 Tax=Dendronephthya gigantea TaxID=151771 RepID=UPI00106C9AB5|nr:von Willebrand factor A domain-containing protein 5A-like [Dendronephthya gigantea]
MQPAVTNTQVSYTTPAGVTVTSVPKGSLPAIFIGERLIVYAILHHSSPSSETQEGTVCLTGDLLGAKVEHNMRFQVPLAVTKDNVSQVSTIHHLAAKRSIKEMESSNDSSPEIIQLSCDSNVISSQTAFIAIDEERKEAVKGSLQTWDILSFLDDEDEYCCYADCDVSSLDDEDEDLGMEGCYGDTDASFGVSCLSAESAPPMPKAQAKSGLKSIFSGLFKRKEVKELTFQNTVYSAPCRPADNESSLFSLPRSSHSSRRSSESTATETPLATIISLQLASGAWKTSTSLSDVISKTTEEIKDACRVSCEGDMESIWATIIVLTYLQLRQSNFKDEWELIALKAETWLTKQSLPQGSSIQDLREKAEAFLS